MKKQTGIWAYLQGKERDGYGHIEVHFARIEHDKDNLFTLRLLRDTDPQCKVLHLEGIRIVCQYNTTRGDSNYRIPYAIRVEYCNPITDAHTAADLARTFKKLETALRTSVFDKGVFANYVAIVLDAVGAEGICEGTEATGYYTWKLSDLPWRIHNLLDDKGLS